MDRSIFTLISLNDPVCVDVQLWYAANVSCKVINVIKKELLEKFMTE